MASIFKQVVGHITGNSDRDLIRVNSQFNSEKFKPLCLIRRQQKHFFFRKFRYIGTGFVLEDVLEGSQKTNIDVDVVGDVCFFEISKRELGGKLSIPVEVGKVDFKSSASQANVINMKLKKMTVNMQQLEDCIQTIKFNLKHGLMKGLMKVRNEHLCVVTEAIITDEELELEQIRTLDGNLKITIFNNPEALEGKKASYQRLRVSSGTVLAYGVHPLQISRYVGTGALLYVENKKVKSSFHTDDIMKTLQTRMSYEMISKCSGGFDSTAMRLQKGSSNSISFTEDTWVLPNEENLFKGSSNSISFTEDTWVLPNEENLFKDFNQIKELIKEECSELHNLSKDLTGHFLKVILKILEDGTYLTAVEEMLEQIMSEEQPDFTLIGDAWNKEDSIENVIKNFIQDLYDTVNQEESPDETPVKPLQLLFTTLNDMQDVSFLADCLNKTLITPNELELVEFALCSCSPTSQDWEFIIDAERYLTKEQEKIPAEKRVKITAELLNKHGVKVQREEFKFKCKGDENSQKELLLLYTTLYIFNILSS